MLQPDLAAMTQDPGPAGGVALPPGVGPLTIRGAALLGRPAMTLCCIVHDEMFFLEAFLAHYRRLGVERFIVLDDRSTDGSAAFLAAQPDVMVVESELRYFDEIDYDPAARALIRETRAVRLWRDQMMNQFCDGLWAVSVDPDEFLVPPEGTSLPEFAARRDAEGVEAVWGAMIDMYPRSVRDLYPAGETRFSLAQDWYFDARRHLRPRADRATPKDVYPGSSARLFARFDVLPQDGLWRRVRRRLSGYRYAPHSMLHKTPLMRWKAGDHFLNCHLTSKPVSLDHVLPIMHFKFTADLARKIDYAVATKGYNQGSRSYRLYATLIERMKARDASFLCRASRKFTSYEDFRRAGAATGPANDQRVMES